MAIELKIRSCDRCGAVTGIGPNEETAGVDNWELHKEWHRRTEQYVETLYLASCNETQDRIAAAIARSEEP